MAISVIDLFSQIQRESPIHRFDPRLKFFAILVFIFASMLLSHPRALLILLVVSLLPWPISRVNIRPALGIMLGGLIFVAGMFIAQLVLNSPPKGAIGEVTYAVEIGPIRIWDQALLIASGNSIRLIIPIGLAVLTALTTDPTMMARAFIRLRAPVSFAFLFVATVRCLPLAAEEAAHTATALQIRGVSGRIRIARLSIFPVFLNTLRRARTLGIACESKAFGARAWKDFYRDITFRRQDWMAASALLLLLAGVMYVRFGLGLGTIDATFRGIS